MKVLKSKGFTLAEMLIVMAVAVVLAAATIPSITGQIEKAKESNDLMIIADAYADAYADAAIQASTQTGTTAIPINRELTFQQQTGGWTVVSEPKLADKTVPDVLYSSKGVTFTFTPDGNGGVTLTGMAIYAGT